MRSPVPVFLVLLSVACGGEPAPPAAPAPAEPAAAAPAPAEHAGHGDQGEHGAHGEAAPAQDFQPAPEGATVSFGSPADGATLSSPLSLAFQVEGMTVQPAGTLQPGTGHHHVIVNGSPVPAGEVVPADEQHIHFGKGQTETTLELPPGQHTLTLQFADGLHRSYGPALSQAITVTVE